MEVYPCFHNLAFNSSINLCFIGILVLDDVVLKNIGRIMFKCNEEIIIRKIEFDLSYKRVFLTKKWVYCFNACLPYFCAFIIYLTYMRNQISIFLIIVHSLHLNTMPHKLYYLLSNILKCFKCLC